MHARARVSLYKPSLSLGLGVGWAACRLWSQFRGCGARRARATPAKQKQAVFERVRLRRAVHTRMRHIRTISMCVLHHLYCHREQPRVFSVHLHPYIYGETCVRASCTSRFDTSITLEPWSLPSPGRSLKWAPSAAERPKLLCVLLFLIVKSTTLFVFTAGAVAVKLQSLGEGYFWNYLFLTLATFTVKLITQ